MGGERRTESHIRHWSREDSEGWSPRRSQLDELWPGRNTVSRDRASARAWELEEASKWEGGVGRWRWSQAGAIWIWGAMGSSCTVLGERATELWRLGFPTGTYSPALCSLRPLQLFPTKSNECSRVSAFILQQSLYQTTVAFLITNWQGVRHLYLKNSPSQVFLMFLYLLVTLE